MKGYKNAVKTKDPLSDANKKALPPGKRTSANGKVYYEYRTNHSDYPSENESWKALVKLAPKHKAHALGLIVDALNHEYKTARKRKITYTNKASRTNTQTKSKTKSKTKTPQKTKSKETVFEKAKRIRKKGENWQNAIKRARNE